VSKKGSWLSRRAPSYDRWWAASNNLQICYGDDERLYYLTDANMNVTALADGSGTVQERYVYDPYGNAAVFDGSWNSQSPAYENAVNFFCFSPCDTD